MLVPRHPVPPLVRSLQFLSSHLYALHVFIGFHSLHRLRLTEKITLSFNRLELLCSTPHTTRSRSD